MPGNKMGSEIDSLHLEHKRPGNILLECRDGLPGKVGRSESLAVDVLIKFSCNSPASSGEILVWAIPPKPVVTP
jgi:hypothetical protein